MMLRISVANFTGSRWRTAGGGWWRGGLESAETIVMTATEPLVLMTIHYAIHAIKLLYSYTCNSAGE